jgi:hypothetical protein
LKVSALIIHKTYVMTEIAVTIYMKVTYYSNVKQILCHLQLLFILIITEDEYYERQ